MNVRVRHRHLTFLHVIMCDDDNIETETYAHPFLSPSSLHVFTQDLKSNSRGH